MDTGTGGAGAGTDGVGAGTDGADRADTASLPAGTGGVDEAARLGEPGHGVDAGGAASLILSDLLETLAQRRQEAMAEMGVEQVHRLRVSTRRLRALVQFLEPVCGKQLRRARSALGPAARQLGELRDLDVLLEHLDCGVVEVADPARTREVLLHHREELALGARQLVEAPTWEEMVAQVATDLDACHDARPAAEVFRELLGQEWRRFGRHAQDLGQLSPRQLHRVRIRAKRLRYAMEVTAPFLGGNAGQEERHHRRLEDLESLQDELGALNDRVVAHEVLVAHGLDPRQDAGQAEPLDRAIVICARLFADPPQEQVLPGGNTARVTRVEDTVRRETGEWTPAVHALLETWARAGIEQTPRVLGMEDQRGTAPAREILSFLPGTPMTLCPPAQQWDPRHLDTSARLLRRLHDESLPLLGHPGPWRQPTREPGEVICLNDFAPYNLLLLEGELSGVIDVDMASPGPRLWDVAYLAYRLAPWVEDAQGFRPGTWGDPAHRVEVLVAAYGGDWSLAQVREAAAVRVAELERYTRARARETGRRDLLGHADMYGRDVGRLQGR